MSEEELLPPIHPGEILLEDFLKPMGISQIQLARDLSVPPRRIYDIVRGRKGIKADTAMRLARYFGTSPDVWLRSQARYDLEVAQTEYGHRIEQEVKVLDQSQLSSIPKAV